jgi:hypothetical protein
MEDEFRTWQSYQKLIKGEEETEYDSGESEDEIMNQLDALGDGLPAGAAPHGAFEDVSPEDLLRELDEL